MCKSTNVEKLITFSIVFIIKLVLLVWFSVAHATSAMLVDKNRTIFLHYFPFTKILQKNIYCFVHQHGCQFTWIKNN